MKNVLNTSCTITDNWLLELACDMVDKGAEPFPIPGCVYPEASERYSEPPRNQKEWADLTKHRAIALLQLLDLIVVNDRLAYDAEWAFVWENSNSISPILPLLSPIRLGKETKSKLVSNLEFDVATDSPAKVSEGALYYLSLARFLGVYYWPSPERSVYLHSTFSKSSSSFVIGLSEFLDNSIKEIVREAVTPLQVNPPFSDFACFGLSILANCKTREGIFQTAMEFRDSKECKMFRVWLQEMDNSLQSGNVQAIAQGLRDVKDVLISIRKGLGLENETSGKTELQIGISPSLSIDANSLRSLAAWIKPKPYHITFLRNHFSDVLRKGDAWHQINRLFPETKDLRLRLMP